MGLTSLTAGDTYDINWDFSNDPFVTIPLNISKITFWLDVTGANSGPIKLVLYTQGATTVDVVVAQGSFNHAANSAFTNGDFEFPALNAAIAPTGLFKTSLGWLTGITGGKLNSATVTIEAVPEPSTWGLMGAGLLGLIGFARRRKSA
ncbi:PEP-CTERM sorting domain-containing protein [Paludibaculum fermentans]|uniref:PEP-CTERM sorting domain-containing protein n=1 Tax=Paludibaculum fermentans TaxID=1473598 RepID=A0A7S7NU56_PALFE|nr:PEP-CTERM sorting domain-containing protein [Paludibaculum fermentans]QOY89779.1 PEP-CTERM sorting domain-containing protein [Paludibaculum fermentans]